MPLAIFGRLRTTVVVSRAAASACMCMDVLAGVSPFTNPRWSPSLRAAIELTVVLYVVRFDRNRDPCNDHTNATFLTSGSSAAFVRIPSRRNSLYRPCLRASRVLPRRTRCAALWKDGDLRHAAHRHKHGSGRSIRKCRLDFHNELLMLFQRHQILSSACTVARSGRGTVPLLSHVDAQDCTILWTRPADLPSPRRLTTLVPPDRTCSRDPLRMGVAQLHPATPGASSRTEH